MFFASVLLLVHQLRQKGGTLKLPWIFRKRRTFEELRQSRAEMRKRACSAWPQVCFLHLAKTAGSSINQLLKRRFADHSGIGLHPEEMDGQSTGALEHLGLVSAHFSIRHLPLLANHRFLFTFLREPVDRVISNYYYLRVYEKGPDPTNAVVLASAKTKTFHQFLLDEHPQVRSFTQNMQANALAWDWRGDQRQETPDLGEMAIAALGHFDFVGLFESYEESLHVLFQQLHWQLEVTEPALVVNQTRERPRAAEVKPETLALIRELNQADQSLYDFAASQWKGKMERETVPSALSTPRPVLG
jgi:hypothetical protein